MATKPWHLPLRLAAGAFILQQGLSKDPADEGTAAWLQQQAAVVAPQLGEMDPKQFAALLSTSEITLGAALLAVGLVPPLVAGLGLTAFGGLLNQLYLRSEGTTQEGSVAPTMKGIPMAKDVWLTAIGLALVLDSIFAPRRHR
jgi:hypothetical protein